MTDLLKVADALVSMYDNASYTDKNIAEFIRTHALTHEIIIEMCQEHDVLIEKYLNEAEELPDYSNLLITEETITELQKQDDDILTLKFSAIQNLVMYAYINRMKYCVMVLDLLMEHDTIWEMEITTH